MTAEPGPPAATQITDSAAVEPPPDPDDTTAAADTTAPADTAAAADTTAAPSSGPALPVLAIVGRPNVGKSTLLNRIVGRREAIVEEKPGVTRDRKSVGAEWQGRHFTVVDTGGWLPAGATTGPGRKDPGPGPAADSIDAKVSRQSEKAIADADAALLVVDVTVGVTDEDARMADLLRRSGKPVFVAVNKVDDTNRESAIWEFVSLGLGEPWPVSALHGRGTGDLLDAVVDALGLGPMPSGADAAAAAADAGERDATLSVAIVGRPNVGKSTLFNRLIGDDRAVVHDMPGTTRDSIDTVIDTEDGPVRFVDTAGLRRRSRIDEGTEYYSMVRALQSIDTADVALLVIDTTEGVTHQDQRLAERIDAAGCPIVVLLNKWETLDADARTEITYQVGDRLHFVGDSPVLKISALTGKGVHRLLPALAAVVEDYHRRVPTRQVNEVLRAAQSAHPAPDGARVLYATQGAADPPTFTLFTNRRLPASYLRYLERSLREAFDFGATPLKLRVRQR